MCEEFKAVRNIAHTGFRRRLRKLRKVYSAGGGSENIALHYAGGIEGSARKSVTGWIHSPGHRRNLLKKSRKIMSAATFTDRTGV